jgi:hypothetical protein
MDPSPIPGRDDAAEDRGRRAALLLGRAARYGALALALAGKAFAGDFFAAAGKADITPDLSKGKFYLAGHGKTGRVAERIYDPLYTRALLLSDGEKTIALVSIDALGIFRLDVQRIRKELAYTDGNSYLFLAATHTHSAPDSVGLWGPRLGVSGVNPEYHAMVLQRTVDLVKELSGRLRKAKMKAAETALNPRGLCQDGRQPVVIDPDLAVMRFVADDGPPIATVVRWSCHAEAAGRISKDVTADIPGAMCRNLEKKGGTCLFFPGAIGGMMKPQATVGAEDVDGRFKDVERIGKAVAEAAEKALAGKPLERPSRLEFSSTTVRIPVENSRYLLFMSALAFGHDIYDSKGRGPLGPWHLRAMSLRHAFMPFRSDFPSMDTEISHMWIGPVEWLGMPSELFPELVLGGYDGEYSFGYPVSDPNNPNAPDLTQAPRGPYLKQLMKGKIRVVTSISNDMLGYLIPTYDFKVTHSLSMLPEPPGEHYEETNSIGRSATSLELKAARALLNASQ